MKRLPSFFGTKAPTLFMIVSSPLFAYIARIVILCLILAAIIQAILFLRYGWGYVVEDMAFYYPPYVFLSHYAFYDFTRTIEKIIKILNEIHPPTFPLFPSKLPPHYVKYIINSLSGGSNVVEVFPSDSVQPIDLSSSNNNNNNKKDASNKSKFKGNLFYSHTKVKGTSETRKKIKDRIFSIPKIIVSTSTGWVLPEIPDIVVTTPKDNKIEEKTESPSQSDDVQSAPSSFLGKLRRSPSTLLETDDLTIPGSTTETEETPIVNEARPDTVPLTPRLKHSPLFESNEFDEQQNKIDNNNNDYHAINISSSDNNQLSSNNNEISNQHKHNTPYIISSVLSTHPSIPTLSNYFSNTQNEIVDSDSDSDGVPSECTSPLDVRYKQIGIHILVGVVSTVASSIIIYFLNEYKSYWSVWTYALELEYWIFWLMALSAFISMYFLKKVIQNHLSNMVTKPFWISSSKAAMVSLIVINSYPIIFLCVYFLSTRVIGIPQPPAWADSESVVGLGVLILIGVCVLCDANRDINFSFHYMVLYCTMIIAPRFFAYVAVTLYVSFGIDVFLVLLLWTIIIHLWLEFQQQICFRALHRQLSLPYLALSQCIDSITHHAFLAFTPLFQLSAFPIILLQIFIYLYRDISLLPYLTRKILNKFPIENDRHRVFRWSIEVQDKDYYVYDLLYAEQYFICDIFSLIGVVTFFWVNGKQAQIALMASLRLVTFFISHLVKGWLSFYPDLLPFGSLLYHPSHWTKHSGFIFLSAMFSIVLICNNMQPALLRARL
eukprot:TRINITY_DN7739_c0_g1_i1.p1 TRINITY_DN7739_c0_g1~~TRINITY_DN7739_c0_g1_i1.p1  ORF type:complete len:775 (+),score=99.97 TRINITY_DN7739_c0_g1_i1:177-2501(+)